MLGRLDISAFGKNAGLFIFWGVLLVILGILALYYVNFTTLFSVIFLGFLFFAGGIIVGIDTFTFWWGKWPSFFLHLLMAFLYIAAGITLINSPILGSISITLFLGIFYFVLGIIRIALSLYLRSPRWGWSFFNGVISLLLGALILAQWPASGLFILGIFVGIDLLFSGWAYIMAGLAGKALVKSV